MILRAVKTHSSGAHAEYGHFMAGWDMTAYVSGLLYEEKMQKSCTKTV